jgi:hypothetical protein
METPPDDNVTYIRDRYVERINRIRMDLGKLSLTELLVLEEQCQLRFQDAHHELVVVRDVREQRFPRGREHETTHETETPPEAG